MASAPPDLKMTHLIMPASSFGSTISAEMNVESPLENPLKCSQKGSSNSPSMISPASFWYLMDTLVTSPESVNTV